MGFRYYRRIGGRRGWGWNISRSGVSPSYRGRHGSFSLKGFSIRTNIPGLYYRHRFRRNTGAFISLIILSGLLFYWMFYLPLLILYNLLRLFKILIFNICGKGQVESPD